MQQKAHTILLLQLLYHRAGILVKYEEFLSIPVDGNDLLFPPALWLNVKPNTHIGLAEIHNDAGINLLRTGKHYMLTFFKKYTVFVSPALVVIQLSANLVINT